MAMEISFSDEAQSLFSVTSKGQAKYQKHSKKKKYGSPLLQLCPLCFSSGRNSSSSSFPGLSFCTNVLGSTWPSGIKGGPLDALISFRDLDIYNQ